MVLYGQVEPPEEQPASPSWILSAARLMGRRHTAVFDHHLEEARRSVPSRAAEW
jgi:hypothetical protein